MINMRSGNASDCRILLAALQDHLGEDNVFELGGGLSPLDVFEAHKAPSERWKLFVCGGDGTVAWVLSVCDEFCWDDETCPRPVICVIPMGTGNDLSRALGWGGGFTDDVDVRELLDRMESDGEEQRLDRWRVVVTRLGGSEAQTPLSSDFFTLVNYISFGCDAMVCNAFAALRESVPALCSSRLGNKVLYTLGGTGAFFSEHVPLDKVCRLELDGHAVALPADIYGIMILNIPSYAGGADLYGQHAEEGYRPQSMRDGLLEIVGVSGTFHLGSSAVGLTEGHRIGQGAELALSFLGDQPIYYQLDGEPSNASLEAPAVVRIRLLDADCRVLVNGKENGGRRV